jgi:hypothetical protein
VLVAVGVEVCLDELDGASSVTKVIRRTFSTGTPAGISSKPATSDVAVAAPIHCRECSTLCPVLSSKSLLNEMAR